MKIILVILGYLKWHYGKAVFSLSRIWGNFLYFVFNFFSIKLLFRNFFDPWKRMADSYPKSFDLKKYLYAFLVNMIVRLVGIVMRTGLIIIGLLSCVLMILAYPLVLAGWLLLPIFIIYVIGTGLFMIITN